MENLYNEEYYLNHYREACGVAYNDAEHWNSEFRRIAQKIVSTIQPKTVLDVGCAFGYLVKAFRDLGVDAWGIDISDYAIEQADSVVRPYLSIQSAENSLPEYFPSHYDLVVSIEMIEHVSEDIGLCIIKNITSWSDNILISASSDDFSEKTHFNVQPREYWVEKFAKLSYFKDPLYDGSYITPQTGLFHHETALNLENLARRYEHALRLSERRTVEECQQLAKLKDNDYNAMVKAKALDIAALSEIREELAGLADNKDAEIKKKNEQITGLSAKLAELSAIKDDEIENKIGQIAELSAQIADYSNLVAYERQETQKLRDAYAEVTIAFSTISTSACWKITKPLRVLLDGIKWLIKLLIHNTLSINLKNLKKVIQYLHIYGLRITLRQIRNKLSGKTWEPVPGQLVQTDIKSEQISNKMLATKIFPVSKAPINAINTVIINEKIKRLNLVTDTIESHSLLGGVATALFLATEFCNRFDYELRIITRTTSVNPMDYVHIIELSGLKPVDKLSFYSDYGNNLYKLEVTKDDLFFATSWWSAYAIKGTSIRKRFFYIIQEVETFFYPHGGEHLLCTQIMQNKNIDFIINSHFLFEYFQKEQPQIAENGMYFEPAFPTSLYKTANFLPKKQYRLFFYARPNNPRNLFAYGLTLLETAINSGLLDTNVWEICCAGSTDLPQIKFCNGYIATNMSQMSWSEYAQFLTTVDLAISLMYTPHPSYPPFDVACSGGVVVSNKYLNKIAFEQCGNVILSELDKDAFMDALRQGIMLATDMKKRKENYENSTIPRDWKETLAETVKEMGRRSGNVPY